MKLRVRLHLSVCPCPAGSSTGTDQAIFYIAVDIWLNLRDGVISALNTQSDQGVFTFDSQYDGQTAQELTGRADSTVFNTVSDSSCIRNAVPFFRLALSVAATR